MFTSHKYLVKIWNQKGMVVEHPSLVLSSTLQELSKGLNIHISHQVPNPYIPKDYFNFVGGGGIIKTTT
jgi:hypothetical protein